MLQRGVGAVHAAGLKEFKKAKLEFKFCKSAACRAMEVTHAVLTHVAREMQTSDLKVLMGKVSALGLACDGFQLSPPPKPS